MKIATNKSLFIAFFLCLIYWFLFNLECPMQWILYVCGWARIPLVFNLYIFPQLNTFSAFFFLFSFDLSHIWSCLLARFEFLFKNYALCSHTTLFHKFSHSLNIMLLVVVVVVLASFIFHLVFLLGFNSSQYFQLDICLKDKAFKCLCSAIKMNKK